MGEYGAGVRRGRRREMVLNQDGTRWAARANVAHMAGVGKPNAGGGASQYVEGRDTKRSVMVAWDVSDIAVCGNVTHFLQAGWKCLG